MRRFKGTFFHSIGFKFTACMSLLLITAMTTTGILYNRQSSQNLEDSLRSNLSNLASDNSALIAEKLKNLQWQVSNTANSEALKTLDWTTQKTALMDDIGRLDLQSFGVCDLSGNITFINNKKENIAQTDFFAAAKVGTDVIGGPRKSEAQNNQSMLYICTPIIDSDNRVKEILVGTLNLNVLSRYVTAVHTGAQGRAFITDRSAAVIASTDYHDLAAPQNAGAQAENAQLLSVQKSMAAGKNGLTHYTKDAGTYLISYAPITGTGFSLGVSVPYTVVTEPVKKLASTLVLITVLFILFAVAGGTLLSTLMITRPIDKTLRFIEEMSRGHLGARLNLKTRDELGRMGREMNEFASYIKGVVFAMRRVSHGELDVAVTSRDAQDEIAPAVNDTISAVRLLVTDSKSLMQSAVRGEFDTRADENRHRGDYRAIIRGFNDTLNHVTESFYFYESVIDSIRLPIIVTSLDRKCLLINTAMEKLTGLDRGAMKNNPCSGCATGLCGTGNCAVDRLTGGDPISKYERDGRHFKVRTSMLGDSQDVHVGYVEIIEDETAAIEIDRYMRAEVENLRGNLEQLADGSFDMNLSLCGGFDDDRYIRSERELFSQINQSLENAVYSIGAITTELTDVNTAILAGNLSARLSLAGKKGFYRDISEGFNSVTEVFSGHFSRISDSLLKISAGEIPELIEETYRGDFETIKRAMNGLIHTMNGLLCETSNLIAASHNGDLSQRAETGAFSGEWKSLITGINEMLTHFTAPINEISVVMAAISEGDFDTAVCGAYSGDFAAFAQTVNLTRQKLSDIVSDISATLGAIATGNLDLPRIRDYDGGFVGISNSLNLILDALNLLIRDIQNTAAGVTVAAGEVSQTSIQLSQGAATQAAAMENLTASLGLVSEKTKDNAQSTQKMSEAAASARDFAQSGNSHMASLMESITRLSSSSSSVSKIIRSIDDISFQTNLLAINAAIEAARAGQYGKGFSAVADEVGRLATSSAESVRESSEIISGSLRLIEEGAVRAAKTSKKFEDIRQGVDAMANLVEHVNEALAQQTKSIAVISDEITTASGIVQETTAMAQGSVHASTRLSREAQNLNGLAQRFRLRTAKE